ncbi:MAG TPA: hypothetical protein VGI97_08130 [Gemmatimonadaceae bacterium]|jgi:hypothetical protein
MTRSLLLFVHVGSAMGMVAALGIESVLLRQLQRSSDATGLRTVMDDYRLIAPVGGASMLLLLLSGLYLATAYWGWKGAWIGAGFLGFILLGAIGGMLTGRSLSGFRKAPDGVDKLQLHTKLRTSWLLRAWIFAGIVFLMTTKP